MEDAAHILPYRVDADGLVRWVESRARGSGAAGALDRSLAPKSREGLALAAAALGLADVHGSLTGRGSRLALAAPEERPGVIRETLLAFRPYVDLFEEVVRRGHRSTDATWVEAFWATRGLGNSASNRREGAAALGRLAHFAGMARYVPGRKGHPTRFEWTSTLLSGIASDAGANPPAEEPTLAPYPSDPPERRESPAIRSPDDERPVWGASNHIVVELGEGQQAELRLPTRLSRAEKRRLLSLVELLVSDD